MIQACGMGSWAKNIRQTECGVYRETWEAALECEARWVIIMTFNDWNEGTEVEPSFEYGYEYLDMTATYASKLGLNTTLEGIRVPAMIYTALKSIKTASALRTAGLVSFTAVDQDSVISEAFLDFLPIYPTHLPREAFPEEPPRRIKLDPIDGSFDQKTENFMVV